MSTADVQFVAESAEKPANGIAGLKYLRHDILSGMVVSLVSLPLSSGIAIASGVPPIYGLISAIIAGLIFPLIGGSYMTIAGPAAGLAPALLAIMATMGGAGDAEHVGEGYHFLLVVIFMVGIVQLGMALLKLARYCAIIPVSVVEGMLASIGMLIIVKQIPSFFGYTGKVHAHEFYQYLVEIPKFAHGMTDQAFAVSFSTLVLLFWLGRMKNVKLLKIIPPQLIAVVIGVVLGVVFRLKDLGPGFLISLPKDPFHGIHAPAFSELLARRDLWYAAIMAVITLTMIDGVESLATAMAIDRIDPYHRKSQPNRLLFAMGVCNIASSLIGGLTIIPGGVKSKANIASGGRTLWANFTNAICLIIYLVFARDLINMIPKGVLASVLIYTGWKMCEPLVWNHMAHIGKEQLAIFSFTIVATLMTDLLWGIIAGTIAKFALNMYFFRKAIQGANIPAIQRPSVSQGMYSFFANPVSRREMVDGNYHLYFNKPLVSFNSMHVCDEFDHIPKEAQAVTVHLDQCVALIDHTSCEHLLSTVEEFARSGFPARVDGLDDLQPMSDYHASVRVARASETLVPAM
ncbi:MAG: SulP family inorganic anion transporter [Planctomycetaceae bacterium]